MVALNNFLYILHHYLPNDAHTCNETAIITKIQTNTIYQVIDILFYNRAQYSFYSAFP